MPGARCTRSRACSVVNTRVSHHGCTGSPGIPARNGFNGFLRALPGDRALLSPSPTNYLHRLERQRRGVRTTRLRRPQAQRIRQSAACVHRIPPRVRDDRDTPLCGVSSSSGTHRNCRFYSGAYVLGRRMNVPSGLDAKVGTVSGSGTAG